MVILSVAKTFERLWNCIRLERVLRHIFKLWKTCQLFSLGAIKLEAVISGNYQLLVISWHIGDFVDHEVKFSKRASFASHEHII
jgi:hypothetical protein